MIRRTAPLEAAKQILEQHPSCIEGCCVNVKSLIETLGIEINPVELPDEVSGLLHVEEGKKPRIFVNALHHSNRQRFTMAHELGHFILHKNRGLHIDKKTFSRNALSQTGLDPIEIEANRFAAELLMPNLLIKQEIAGKEDLVDSAGYIDAQGDFIYELAQAFGVSTAAMSIRLQSLGYLPQEF